MPDGLFLVEQIVLKEKPTMSIQTLCQDRKPLLTCTIDNLAPGLFDELVAQKVYEIINEHCPLLMSKDTAAEKSFLIPARAAITIARLSEACQIDAIALINHLMGIELATARKVLDLFKTLRIVDGQPIIQPDSKTVVIYHAAA